MVGEYEKQKKRLKKTVKTKVFFVCTKKKLRCWHQKLSYKIDKKQSKKVVKISFFYEKN